MELNFRPGHLPKQQSEQMSQTSKKIGDQASLIPCDVLPDRKAVLHDNFSGCNFCMEIVELFKKYDPQMYETRILELNSVVL